MVTNLPVSRVPGATLAAKSVDCQPGNRHRQECKRDGNFRGRSRALSPFEQAIAQWRRLGFLVQVALDKIPQMASCSISS